MKKTIISTIFLLSLSFSVFGQSIRTDFDLSGFGVRVKTDKRLIAVRVALELSGIQTELSPDGIAFRNRVQNDFKKVSPTLKQNLETFVTQYQRRYPKKSQVEIISPFVSMAYSLTPAPELKEPQRSIDLPDELLDVLDYSPLVRELYGSPGAAELIDGYFEDYQKNAELLVPSARDMVRDVLDYLHTRPQLSYIERVKVEVEENKKKLVKYEPVERFRTFTIVPDFLATKGNINFLSIRDEYFAIVPFDTNISSSEVRRAFLHFVADPLIFSQAREIALHTTAIRLLLSERRKTQPDISPDPVLAVSRSFVAAVDISEEQTRKLRLATEQAQRKIVLMQTDDEKRAVSDELRRVEDELADEALLRLSESFEKGAVFAFYFAEKLVGIESGFDVKGSIPAWILGLNPKTENARYEASKVAAQRAILARERRKTEQVTTLVENPLTQELLKIDESVTAKKYVEAEEQLNALLVKYSANRYEAGRIYYSLGRMTSKAAEDTEDGEEVGTMLQKAAEYYKNVIPRAGNDAALISSTYFALGRIYEHFNQNDYALQIYDAALRMGKVPGGAFEEAFEAKKNLLAKQQQD